MNLYDKLKTYWFLFILFALIIFGASISWFNGDQTRIVQEFVNQSNSNIAKTIRNESLNAFGTIGFGTTLDPLLFPTLHNTIIKHDQERANLLLKTFQKELLRDAVLSDLPTEYGVFYNIYNWIDSNIYPLYAFSNNDSWSWSTITCEIGDDSTLLLNKNLDQPHLLFVISQNPDILEIDYEDLEYNNVRLVGKKKGKTKIEILLIQDGGSRIITRNIIVK